MKVGDIPSGSLNCIGDVEGISVGNVNIDLDGLCTGLTAVSPYPLGVKDRTCHIGRWSLDNGGGASGLGVAEDFGIFSSPIILAPAPSFGRVYEAMIQQGIKRDGGLSTSNGWPPIIMSLNDGVWNDVQRVYENISEAHVNMVLSKSSDEKIYQGNFGIGRSLRAFGFRGGIGTASRVLSHYTVGVLVAINGGLLGDLRIGGSKIPVKGAEYQEGPQEFCIVVATDAPLLPIQLRSLAERAGLGAARCALWNPFTQQAQVIAFSTSQLRGNGNTPIREFGSVQNETLLSLYSAVVDSVESAVLSGLLAAQSLEINGRKLKALRLSEHP
tara:strand:+ start:4866 stop:5849 length:984 start_codon:yes stop_codon:yes gene_type:complete